MQVKLRVIVYMKNLSFWFRRQTPPRILVTGFMLVIAAGALLLWMPFTHNRGYSPGFLDCLFVSTSAVCVTGLTTIPIGYTFNIIGRAILMVLIQIGGWGVATAAVLFSLFVGRKISLKSRQLLIEASNLNGYRSAVEFVRCFVNITLVIEALGTLAVLPVFLQDHAFLPALGYSLFHSVSAFNNAGFDILGGFDSLLAYKDNFYMIMVTSALVISGGFGFLAMLDIWRCRKVGWRQWALNTKIVAMMTIFLLSFGMLTLKWTTSQSWLQAWFQSVIARTAGFNTFPLSDFSQAGLLIFCMLMFIGANPGSTGGGIKTTTIFALFLKAFSSTMHNNRDTVFHRRVPKIIFEKALTVFVFAFVVVLASTVLVLCFENQAPLSDVLVETTSAVATVGSSVGLTPHLSTASRLVIIVDMFIGRLGPVTIATLLVIKGPKEVHYTDEQFLIG